MLKVLAEQGESMNLDKVKDRIRKLLAIAADDAQADGEITAAMALAEKAMREHHLERADLEAADKAAGRPTVEETYGTADVYFHGVIMTAWENVLRAAVERMVGSVNCYRTRGQKESGTFRTIKTAECLRWYGTAEDVQLAAGLFEEWRHVIATLAIGRFGGFARNDGARYAYGFAQSLADKAREAAAERRKVVTPSTTAIVLVGAGSLADMLQAKKAKAETWLAGTGVKLSSRRRSPRLRMSGSGVDAYQAGRLDGQRAEFSAKRVGKLS